ncbi:ABC transporter substrate-binding protein [Desulfosarcina ovata subsp. sediminis]|uniref:ABC transporter substrate-binding protein n=1 Tax=Desulfosarcina ovata subsp. sediminis TaxID=885957 RepID=A0A5K8A1Q2_9BACT|nr:ABC transporter substrate-binding protein [Desulfosarcina ovata]BBO86473.1 ABC transporter substrate-binding protein [Desulfosarcina ovata subsp. sediminis]
MREKIRTIVAIVTGLWMVFMGSEGLSATPPPSPCVKTVVDRTGAQVCLPAAINRIVITCYGGASHEIALFGGSRKVVAQPSIDRFPLLAKIYENFVDVPDAGAFDNVNLETILALQPDVVFAGIVSPQGNQRIRTLGIPVVVLGIGRADIDNLLKEFTMVGGILGAEETAAALVAYWNDRLSLIRNRLASIPEEARKKVFYGTTGPPFRTEGGLWWGHHFIRAAGGINAAQEIKMRGGVTPEQLLLWNPDVIIITTNHSQNRQGSGMVGDIRNHPKYRNIAAVKNNAMFACPIGTFWWDRPSPEAILGILWLAKTLYPRQMEALSIKIETKRFFSRFYHYALSDAEFNAFFSTVGKVNP